MMCEECYRIEEIAGREQGRLIEEINSHICDGGDPLTDPRVIKLVEAVERYFEWLDRRESIPLAGGSSRRGEMRTALANLKSTVEKSN